MRLKDKVALVAGGGSGIGHATAVLFAAQGAKVVVSDLNEANALETVAEIKTDGGDATALGGDVSKNSDAEAMVRGTVETYGSLDTVVNCAGVIAGKALPEGASPEEVWDRVMEVNLKGTYLVTWHAVRTMEQSGGGSIINIASINGIVGYPIGLGGGFDAYVPSKGGVVQFTKNLAIDYGKKNIRVNCICPGHIDTNLIREFLDNPERREWLEQRYPMGRIGRPEEIAYAALFLASDESSFVTGAPLIVDGGYTAQ
ncbi:short-chain dehydrogenase [Candidatus Poribacteria bacterium]|nr:MAG: short-chain dehydrogenase [Candidatus Poribacteria bacterium]